MSTRILVVDDSPTIRKVVCGLLERHGYEAVAAGDGQVALEMLAHGKFDLVLLDFVMPRMNGFQFCRMLRSNEALRGVPVVLMSAKSDKIREQFVLQTGAIDAITKPFDATALVATIENAIKRSTSWRERGEALSAGIPDDFEPVESAKPPAVDGEARRLRAVQEIAARIAATLARTVSKLPHEIQGDEVRLASALVTHVPHDALRELAEGLRRIDTGAGGKLCLSGDLASIPIGAVLQLLQIENQSGVLAVSTGDREVLIAMRRGLIDLVLARGTGAEFRLGRYFVEQGIATPEQIEDVVRQRDTGRPPPPSAPPPSPPPSSFSRREDSTATRRLLGEMLLESGKVTGEQLKEALARQSSELTYEVLRWQAGRFEFRREPPPALAQGAQLGLPVASVVMEGFRRVDEWRLIETGLGSFDAVLQKDPLALDALGDATLGPSEAHVLEMVDGERTVREIVAASHMSSFDACKILFQLLEARLVRRRST